MTPNVLLDTQVGNNINNKMDRTFFLKVKVANIFMETYF